MSAREHAAIRFSCMKKTYLLLNLVGAAALATAVPTFTFAQTRDASVPYSTITPVKDLNKLFDSLDRDHDGSISAAEFQHLSSAMAGIGSGQTARAGEADSSAFRSSKLSQDDLFRVFKKLDANNDNRVTRSEFMNFNEVVAENGGKR